MAATTRQRRANRQGFTLAEVMLAMAILAFLATITAGTLKRVAAGNRRVGCATNLHNLHQALEWYKLDEGRYPAFDPVGNIGDPGPGLWALLTYYRDPNAPTGNRLPVDAPRTGYLSSPKTLHCPEDRAHSTYTNPNTGMDAYFYDVPHAAAQGNYAAYDIETFCSYQVLDDHDNDDSTAPAELRNEYTYLPDRGVASGADYRRQLQPTGTDASWHPSEKTVITWCPWHRDRSKPRDYDLVLFLDGQVDFTDKPTATTTGWQRDPITGAVGEQ